MKVIFEKVPYKIKMLVFIQITILIAISALGVVVYRSLTGLIEKEMGMRARGVALAASYLINEKPVEYLQLKTVKDEKNRFYLEMKGRFQQFKATNNLRYMYTERQVSKDKIVYVLDAEPTDSEYISHIGDEDDMNDLRRKAYSSRRPEYGPLTDDPKWGKFITGYAPLINPMNGQFIGLIGVDIEAAEVFQLFNQLRLLITFTIIVIMIISVTINYKLADLITRPVYLDGMTGTYNHKYFQETLSAEISKAERSDSVLSLLMIDLDFFKQVNDNFGHRFGDKVLSDTARIIKSICHKKDVVARYGGEEFMIILPGADGETALNIAGRIREAIEEKAKVTVSIGISLWAPGVTKNQLIDQADQAMYASKRKSRNTVTLYSKDMEDFKEIAATI